MNQHAENTGNDDLETAISNKQEIARQNHSEIMRNV